MTKLYKALVRPNLEFGMCVASPLNKGDQQKLETVQRQATKAIEGCKYLNYSSRLKRLKLPTLVYRHKRGDIIMTHKLLNYNSPLNKLFQLDQSARTASLPGSIVGNCIRRELPLDYAITSSLTE